MPGLGELETVPIRSQWPDEARDFTPWLSTSGLDLLSDVLGIPLLLEGTEQPVGPYFADVVCLAAGPEDDSRRVVIENQFGRSDHDHLGKLLTYVAGKDAYTAVWIAEEFREEHVAAFQWLNENSGADKEFWALELQLWRIGESLPAPWFSVQVAPNAIIKAVHESEELSEQRRGRLEFWEGFHQFVSDVGVGIKVSKPVPDTWLTSSVGRTGAYLSFVFSNYDLEHRVSPRMR